MSERIGPFVLGPRLGVGGMGVVHAARDEALERTVALKVISPHLADDEEFRARFVREARAMASLDSPHVVHVYAHGEDEGRLWIASQLVPDGDLGTLLRRSGAPPLPLALDLVAQVASGLADAHTAGLVHRDIKPANVLLRRSGAAYTAYLADFGIARRAGGDLAGFTQGVVGTPSYMAPELHTGGAAGVASDIYSLGCLLWSTLVGHAPYGGTSDYQIVSAHLDQPVPQLEGDTPVVREVNRVLRTAMAKEPAARYPDAAAMRDDLRAIERLAVEGPTVVRPGAPARPGGAPSRPGAPGSRPGGAPASPAAASGGRNRTVAIAGLALAVLLGAGIGWWALDAGHVSRVFAGTSEASPQAPSAATPTVSSPPTDPSTSPTDEPTTDPSEPTSDPTDTQPPGGDYTPAQRQAAVASFSAALRTQPSVTPEAADCVAETVVDSVGLPAMVEAGFFDESMTFVDQDLADHPELKQAFTTATFSCVAGG